MRKSDSPSVSTCMEISLQKEILAFSKKNEIKFTWKFDLGKGNLEILTIDDEKTLILRLRFV